ncbi:MAG: PepSY domain-containing protein [Burkholderiales bacterium]|nr:PepSY domain-containing protein [Burkholderiales bacterium]
MNLRRLSPLLLAVAATPVWSQTLDLPAKKLGMEACLQAVLAQYPGKVLSVELEIEQGVPLYEFEIKSVLDGNKWEVECNADTGAVVKAERDVEPTDPAFTSIAKISVAEALKIALKKVPGIAKEVEYEISPDGHAWYEFTIVYGGGKRTEVSVDAATGAVIATEDERDELEVYRIGADD